MNDKGNEGARIRALSANNRCKNSHGSDFPRPSDSDGHPRRLLVEFNDTSEDERPTLIGTMTEDKENNQDKRHVLAGNRKNLLEKVFRKYGNHTLGCLGKVKIVAPPDSQFALVEFHSKEIADLAMSELGDRFNISKAPRDFSVADLERTERVSRRFQATSSTVVKFTEWYWDNDNENYGESY